MRARSGSFFVVMFALSGCFDDRLRLVGQDDAQRGVLPDASAPDPASWGVASVRIDPEDVRLDVQGSTRPTVNFRLRGVRENGTFTADLPALWTVTNTELGAIDGAEGTFATSGQAGGAARVRATAVVGGVTYTAETSLAVFVRREVFVGEVPADAPSRFNGTLTRATEREANLVYPLDGAVMPQNVPPADIQWTRGRYGDLFHVRLRKSHADVHAYVAWAQPDFGLDWRVEETAWRSLAATDGDAPATITVDRWDAEHAEAIAGSPITVRFARGVLLGSVYYWDGVAGQPYRIDDGTTDARPVVANVPAAPRSGMHCLGCHTVSQDGRYLAGRLHGNSTDGSGVIFDLTADLWATTPPTVFPVTTTSPDWMSSSFSPDSRRLVVDYEGGLDLVDTATGRRVLPGANTLPGRTTRSFQPSWSPDGTRIAYITNATGVVAHSTSGDLAVIPVTAPDTFGTPAVIHRGSAFPGAVPAGPTDSWPSWSPDSRWIAFAHGDFARSQDGHGALYLIAPTGGAPVRLDRACGGADSTDSFYPKFSPFDSGGYFWVSFLSLRDYGNERVGTRGSRRQQIWIAALRRTPRPDEDPSEVPYWLPGQNPRARNLSAYWAPRACRRDREECGTALECCSGQCALTASGRRECQPVLVPCRAQYQRCGGAGCCEGLRCANNVCVPPPV